MYAASKIVVTNILTPTAVPISTKTTHPACILSAGLRCTLELLHDRQFVWNPQIAGTSSSKPNFVVAASEGTGEACLNQ